MTTIFPKNHRFRLLSNGVVEEQFNRCNEKTGLVLVPPSVPPAVAAALHLPNAPSVDNHSQSADNHSLENANVVKSEIRSLVEYASEPEIDILINNVVCSFSLGCHLNLRHIALNAHNVEYRRESGVVTMKLRKPQITASLWSSGKITCTGATSADDAKSGARRVARIIQKLGFDVKFRKMRIVNVLGSCSMPFEIKITAFSQRYREAEYEPELHPGVTYKVKNPKATLKIFSTGSITVTAPSVENVQLAIEHIYPLVFDFRKAFTNREDIHRKRTLTQQRLKQENLKRRKLNSNNSCSSNDDEDKEVENITSQ